MKADHKAALARAVALARRVSAWLLEDPSQADGFDRAHARLLEEFAADPRGEPSSIGALLDRHRADADAEGRADTALAEAMQRTEETWGALQAAVAAPAAKPRARREASVARAARARKASKGDSSRT